MVIASLSLLYLSLFLILAGMWAHAKSRDFGFQSELQHDVFRAEGNLIDGPHFGSPAETACFKLTFLVSYETTSLWPLIKLLLTGRLRAKAATAVPARPKHAKKIPTDKWEDRFPEWRKLRQIADDLSDDIREPFERAHCAFLLALTYDSVLLGPLLRHTICYRISKVSRHRYVGFDDALFLTAIIIESVSRSDK